MKTRTIVSLLSVSIATPVVAAGIHFQAEPPPAPTSVAVVRVANTPLSAEMVVRRGMELGMPAAYVRMKTPGGVALQWADPTGANTTTLFRDPYGSEFFATNQMASETPGAFPAIQDTLAKELALRFLTQHPGLVNTQESQISGFQHLIHQGEDLQTGRLSGETQDETIVRFGRVVAGIPVIGPGDQAEIHIANDSSVTGMISEWRRVFPKTATVPIQPYAVILDKFISRLSQELGNSPDDANVTEIRFGYYSRPGGQPQGSYTPVYDFVVSFYNPELQQVTGARHIYLPAIDPALMTEPLDQPTIDPVQGTPGSVVFRSEPPTNLPQVVPLFQVLPTIVNQDMISRRASSLGFTNTNVQPQPRGLLVSDTSRNLLLSQDTFGAEFFGHMDRFMSETPGEAPPLPDSAAHEIALSYLNQIGGFDPSQFGPAAFSHLFNQGFDVSANRLDPSTQDETIVTFPRQIPTSMSPLPIPVIGVGSGIQVHVDNKGNITGHRALWRNTQAVPGMEAPILPYSTVQQAFLRQMAAQAGASKVIVSRVQFGYYERPEGVTQGFLQPAFVFDAALTDPNDPTETASGHIIVPVPASPTTFESLDDEASNPNDPTLTDDPRAPVPTAYGDWNGDGVVDITDVIGAVHGVAGLDLGVVTPLQVATCDVAPASSSDLPGGDGSIGLDDCLRILRSVYSMDNIVNGA